MASNPGKMFICGLVLVFATSFVVCSASTSGDKIEQSRGGVISIEPHDQEKHVLRGVTLSRALDAGDLSRTERNFLGFCINRDAFGTPLKPLGSSCKCFHECSSLACNRGKCVCRRDSHCPSGQMCVQRTLLPNYCRASIPTNPGMPLGSRCFHGGQCASGRCEWLRCVCNRSSDCPAGKRCKRRLGRNKCV